MDSDPNQVHEINFEAGEHALTFTLTDETGLERTEIVNLLVVESDPVAVIYEPLNNQFYAPGEMVIFDSNGTGDADNDITKREWRLHEPGEVYPSVISNSAFFTTNMLPGVHHISLFVEDRRGGFDEVHLNITVASSNPDLSNLTVSPKVIPVGELTVITVSVALDDPDGTTQQVNATIARDIQSWTFNLTDEDGDGIWVGEVEVIGDKSGIAQLKVTALDGQNADFMTLNVEFVEEESDPSSLFMIAGGVASFILAGALIAWLIVKRRKRLADLDLIDSWSVFGGEPEEYDEEILEK